MEAVAPDRARFIHSNRFFFRQFIIQHDVYISLALLLLIGLIATPKLYEGQTFSLVLRQAVVCENSIYAHSGQNCLTL